MHPRKKLPVGIQTFPVIRSEPFIYIDKTEFIWQLVDSGRYYFLSRPRRFGKSLLVDTLRCLFEGRREWFAGLWIDDRWDWEVRYPVLKLSLGGGVLTDQTDLQRHLHRLLTDYEPILGVTCTRREVLRDHLQELLRLTAERHGCSVVVLVDEYDKPILDHLTDPDQAQAMREILRDFYSVLKDSEEYLRFLFLTGASKFSKVSVFSGLNHLRDITLDTRYSALCGYTQANCRAGIRGLARGSGSGHHAPVVQRLYLVRRIRL
jgi:hypothetical protein